jgi:iron(III)-salmochelin esterase
MPLRRAAPAWDRQRPDMRAQLLFWLTSFALLLFCATGLPERTLAAAQLVTLNFSLPGPGGKGVEQALAVWSAPALPDDKLPLVVAFHGKGESMLGPARGYTAWIERYGLNKAYAALLGAPLTAAAFGGLVREPELSALNAELRARAFQGVVTVGVYTPDLLAVVGKPERIAAYAAWVARELVPAAQRAVPVASAVPRQVGVDGVSLGGMVALEVGLRYPDVFGAVGSMQPAVRGREAQLADLAEAARGTQQQALRLLSSDADPLLPVTQELSQELRKRRIAHQLVVTPGGHDYAFNRGPGAIELLHFHDRALRELPQ